MRGQIRVRALAPGRRCIIKHLVHTYWRIVPVIAVCVVAAYAVARVFAAGPAAAFLVADASLSGSASVQTQDGAIGGKMVQFGTLPVGSPAPTPAPKPGSGSSSGSSSGGSAPSTPAPTAQSCAAYPAFPDANCTGVPSGTTLTAYTGSCTITANNTVIDAKTVNCFPLSIRANGVAITNSHINGSVATPSDSTAYSFTITDSEVVTPKATAWNDTYTSIGEANFTALRVDTSGGNRGIYCRKACTVRDSYVHGQSIAQTPEIHVSGIRQSQGALIIHNRVVCEPPTTPTDGGCSGDLTGYGDYEPVKDNRIEKNLFMATPGGSCAYGGSSGDDGSKPYGNQASNIVFIDNVFERGSNGNCAIYVPILHFDSARPGNQWINNKWDNGATVPAYKGGS